MTIRSISAMTQVSVPVNDRGYRIGQHHHRAGLTDADVELIRILHERDGLSYTALAYKFEVPKSTIAAICQYKRRAPRPSQTGKPSSAGHMHGQTDPTRRMPKAARMLRNAQVHAAIQERQQYTGLLSKTHAAVAEIVPPTTHKNSRCRSRNRSRKPEKT